MTDRKPSRNAQNQADREAIRRSGSLQFLLDVVAGKPAPVRDAAGRIIDWTDAPELSLRVSTAQSLVKKILPDLAAQQIDFKSTTEGTLQILLAPGVVPPASVDARDVIDGQASDAVSKPAEIEYQEPLETLNPPQSEPGTAETASAAAPTPEDAAEASPMRSRRRRRRAE
ncbi:hypothetical protein [Maritimibacter fusiformis]|uniref:Uncharacterized protein n=1 Tax=Maritimibacter fusiformis TaxID=2603819 RepID=A0A5D0RRH0_9RHOB|nr:hypothetical protein [Maritimibacter fusiformis]TYB83121.1 hypothetical protein FVF75_02765 [Maritimibacter fusiformis]